MSGQSPRALGPKTSPISATKGSKRSYKEGIISYIAESRYAFQVNAVKHVSCLAILVVFLCVIIGTVWKWWKAETGCKCDYGGIAYLKFLPLVVLHHAHQELGFEGGHHFAGSISF